MYWWTDAGVAKWMTCLMSGQSTSKLKAVVAITTQSLLPGTLNDAQNLCLHVLSVQKIVHQSVVEHMI